EILRATATLGGHRRDPQRMWVPFGAIGTRSMATIPGSKGGYLAGVTVPDPIDTLRPWSVVAGAGVTSLDNLQNSVSLPRTVTNSSASWLNEGGSAPSESPPSLGEVSMVARTVETVVKFSMQLL